MRPDNGLKGALRLKVVPTPPPTLVDLRDSISSVIEDADVTTEVSPSRVVIAVTTVSTTS